MPRVASNNPTGTGDSEGASLIAMNAARARDVTLADPNNPLSVVTQTDTTTVNGRVSRSVFDASARRITNTSPANRRVVTTLDVLGRPSSVQVGTLLPTTFIYDASGRLESQTQGDRTTSFTYDAAGYLASVTDPLDRTVQLPTIRSGAASRRRSLISAPPASLTTATVI